MFSWASRRRFTYLASIGAVLLVVIGIPTLIALQTEPTCFDDEQNQDERGVDCGGACSLMCKNETQPLNLLWSRAFKVAEGNYNVLAYMENPSVGMGAEVGYRFEIYDNNNVLIDDRVGSMIISESGPVALFEAGVRTNIRTPGRVFFSLLNEPVWYRAEDLPQVTVEGERAGQSGDGMPRVDATVYNPEVHELHGVEVTAVVYDQTGNALGVSRTVVSSIASRERKAIFFTWSAPFTAPVGRIELIPSVPPQSR